MKYIISELFYRKDGQRDPFWMQAGQVEASDTQEAAYVFAVSRGFTREQVSGWVGTIFDVGRGRYKVNRVEEKQVGDDSWRQGLDVARAFAHYCGVWFEMSEEGHCDGIGGFEWRRVTAAWILADMPDPSSFIAAEANRPCPVD